MGVQMLPHFYAEDLVNVMNKERRREALSKFVGILKGDIDREKKGRAGVENLAKALQETPKFGGEESQQDVQEKLQHYIDQVEVNIASQVCTKSHHFFQVMTYHNALMSQPSSLISVVRTVRGRLDSVKDGVEAAIRVPQLAVRMTNLESVLGVMSTIDTLH